MDQIHNNYIATFENYSQQNVILRAILDVFKTDKNKDNSVKGFVYCVVKSMPHVVLLLILNHLCKNSNLLIDFLRIYVSEN